MTTTLSVHLGQCSEAGRKRVNQDACGSHVPDEPLLTSKGIALAVADGISSSEVSDVASKSAVRTFLDDYYATPEAWSVKTSGERVLAAVNAWLFSQTQRSQYRFDRDKGYVCTFSALILKSRIAHVLHVGDTRVYRFTAGRLERLTRDHRLRVSEAESYLEHALGAAATLHVDYYHVEVREGDAFVLTSDGAHEHLSEAQFAEAFTRPGSLDDAARHLSETALAAGSSDNVTVQLARVVTLPDSAGVELLEESSALPFAPVLSPGEHFEGYEILRELHASHRSYVYLVRDTTGDRTVALKIPASEVREDPTMLQRFLLEEWVARRIHSPHVLAAYLPTRPRNFHYLTTEYVAARTLAQWMLDHPQPNLETVRRIIEQVARGLRAFHRQEMLHQDLRPENILIDEAGTVKIIDFGSVHVSGLAELHPAFEQATVPGAMQYAAPEYFLGEFGSVRSDLYSLGVLTYQLLSGRLPYGDSVPRARTRKAQSRLRYRTVLAQDREIPAWLDFTLRKAVHPDPRERYAELSEFTYDLRHPNSEAVASADPGLLERDPALFWKCVSFLLCVLLLVVFLVHR
jgi:serine/threonine protein phosphatase PrpC